MKSDGVKLDLVVRSFEHINERIAARFPDSTLRKISAELTKCSSDLARDGRKQLRVTPVLRAAGWVGGIVVVGFITIPLVTILESVTGLERLPELLESIAAVVTILAGGTAGFFTMKSIERRQVQQRALGQLHRLREFIVQIGVVQISKSPVDLMVPWAPTKHSRARGDRLDLDDMCRYLGYCCETSALISTLAVALSGWVPDPVVLSASNDLQERCSDLEHKLLAKLQLLELVRQRRACAV